MQWRRVVGGVQTPCHGVCTYWPILPDVAYFQIYRMYFFKNTRFFNSRLSSERKSDSSAALKAETHIGYNLNNRCYFAG